MSIHTSSHPTVSGNGQGFLASARRLPLSFWLGAGVALLGVVVLAGHATQSLMLVRALPWHPATMVINTALCLLAGGMALALFATGHGAARRIATLLGACIILLAGASLLENVFNCDFGIDQPALHRWIDDTASHPGRMPPTSSLGLAAFGLALVLSACCPVARLVTPIRVLTATAIVAGLIGLSGNLLQLDFLFPSHGISHAALHSALGLILLGVGLWWLLSGMLWSRAASAYSEAGLVVFIAAWALVVVGAIAGLVGFSLMQQRVESILSENLTQRLRDHTIYFDSVIEQRIQRVNMIALQPAFAANFAQWVSQPEKLQQLQQLQQQYTQRARGYLQYQFSAFAFLRADGSELGSAGIFHEQATTRIALQGPVPSTLLWDEGFYLRTEIPIQHEGTLLGHVVAEQPLWQLTRLSFEASSWGKTGEMAICGAQGPDAMACYPQRFRPEGFSLPRELDGRPLPMSHALDGASGAMKTLDYRRQRVLAAYRPVGDTGLGMVMKMDLAEVYAPILERFVLAVPLIAILIVLGILILRRNIRPLLKRINAIRREAESNEARFRAASESSLDDFCILESVRDAAGAITDFRYRYLNANHEKLIGKTRTEVMGRPLGELFPVVGDMGILNQYRSVVESGAPITEEFPNHGPDGTIHWIHHTIVRLDDGVAVTSRDVTERKLTDEKLLRMAQNDSLTGLPNRALFLDRLEGALLRARRNSQLMALMFLDVDHFKQINDTHGHAAGDEILKAFARCLQDCVRNIDTVARLGGDEFTIILENLRGRQDAERIATSIGIALRDGFDLPGQKLVVTSSIGLAFHDGGESGAALIARAAAALYEVKRRGRNGWYAEPSATAAAASV